MTMMIKDAKAWIARMEAGEPEPGEVTEDELGDGIENYFIEEPAAPPAPKVDFFASMPADKYHADHTAYSNSMLKDFRDRRRLFEAKYITHNAPPEKSTTALDMGDLAHAALLEPHKLDTHYVEIPEGILASNGAISTKEAKAFVSNAEAKGIKALKREQFAIVRSMVESVKTKIKPWLDVPSKREHAIYWTHPATRLPLKCRTDWIIELPDAAIVLDFKTTTDASPSAFKFASEDYCYWGQHCMYVEAVRQLTNKPVQMYFVVVEKTFPFSSSICRMDEDTVRLGEEAQEQTLTELARCLKTGDWSEPWEKTINPISCRPWKIKPDQNYT